MQVTGCPVALVTPDVWRTSDVGHLVIFAICLLDNHRRISSKERMSGGSGRDRCPAAVELICELFSFEFLLALHRASVVLPDIWWL